MERYVVVSFHDLAPHSLDVCCDVLNDLRGVGIERLSLLVTPKWHDGELMDASPDFLERLRELERDGHEISLHGFTHRSEEIKGGPVAQAMGGFIPPARASSIKSLTTPPRNAFESD